MPRFRSAIVVLILVAILGTMAGCKTAPSASSKTEATPTPIPPPPVPDKPTYTVKRGSVVDSLSFTGRVAPVVEEELFFRTNGRVKKVYVERNDEVQKGTLLAELENDDLMRQLTQAEIELEAANLDLQSAQDAIKFAVQKAQIALEMKKLTLAKMEASDSSIELAIARANLAKVKAGPSAEDKAIAQSQLEQAKNSLWAAQAQRDSTCGRDKTSADCDSAQANVQRAEQSVRISELQLQQMLKGATAEDIAIAEANYQRAVQNQRLAAFDIEMQRQQIKLAELEMTQLEKEIDPKLTKAVERARLSVERLQAQLAETQIYSPIDGKVTSVSAYDGREVAAYKEVFIVADEKELEITAEPMSSQLQRLAEGMKAAIVLSAYPGKELPGEIIQLPYPYGRGGGANVSDVEQDKLSHISFDPQDLAIEPGDLVKVIVTLEQKDDALWLPPAAIRTFSGRNFVVVEEEGRQRRVDITIGIESAERVEIKDGLTEGQVVVGQ